MFEDLEIGQKAPPFELERLCTEEIAQRNGKGNRLADHGCNRSPGHSPFTAENKDGIENDVDDGSGQHGGHGHSRAPVSANDGVHHIGQHIDGKEGQDPVKILYGISNAVFAPNSVKSCVLSGKKTAIKTMLVTNVAIMPVPMAL